MTTTPPPNQDDGAQVPPQSNQPQQPQQPQPQQPQQGQPQYSQPQQPQQGQPQYGAAPSSDPSSTIALNYWLSVFFTWIPALIFYIIERDKGDARSFAFHRENLNFSLVRTLAGVIVGVFAWLFVLIPYIGWFISLLMWIALGVLFVFHIVAAARAVNDYRSGSAPQFIWNISFLK